VTQGAAPNDPTAASRHGVPVPRGSPPGMPV
jgi:hypothetical protein